MGEWAVHGSRAPGRSQWLGSECKPWVEGRAGERGLQENVSRITLSLPAVKGHAGGWAWGQEAWNPQ